MPKKTEDKTSKKLKIEEIQEIHERQMNVMMENMEKITNQLKTLQESGKNEPPRQDLPAIYGSQLNPMVSLDFTNWLSMRPKVNVWNFSDAMKCLPEVEKVPAMMKQEVKNLMKQTHDQMN